MPVDFGSEVYAKSQDVFGRTVIFSPIASQPNQSPYTGRGIYSTEAIEVSLEDESSFSDSSPILDILESEFSVLPIQGDHLTIPADGNLPALGDFAVIDTKSNGGGETTLQLRKVVENKPA